MGSPQRSARRTVGIAFVAFGAFVLASTVHCGKHSGTTSGTGGNLQVIPELRDVIFQGGATDEGAYALLHIASVTDPQLSASFTYPTDGAVISSSQAPTFTWQSTLASVGMPGGEPWRYTRLEAPPVVDDRREPWLVFAIPEAHAHGIPMSGPGYFIHFTTASNPQVLRVFTENTSYTPDATAFAKLRAAGGTIQASILNAIFSENRIALGAGPYQGATITFSIQ
jgi:hypothetical protein